MGFLHAQLRSATRCRHAGVEMLFEQFDISRETGACGFLRAHAASIAAVRAANPDANDKLSRVLKGLETALETDLHTLQCNETIPEISLPGGKWNSLGVTYVIAGSRLGAKVLSRRVATARESNVQSANRYLTWPGADHLWRDFQQIDKEYDPELTDITPINSAAEAVFECFGLAAETVLNGQAR